MVFDDTKFEVTLPCIKGMGSCKLPLCDIWTLWYNDLVCPFFTKYGRPCSCPVEKGTFVADKVEVEVPFDKIKGTIGQFASVNPSSTLKYSQKSANQNFSSKGWLSYQIPDQQQRGNQPVRMSGNYGTFGDRKRPLMSVEKFPVPETNQLEQKSLCKKNLNKNFKII